MSCWTLICGSGCIELIKSHCLFFFFLSVRAYFKVFIVYAIQGKLSHSRNEEPLWWCSSASSDDESYWRHHNFMMRQALKIEHSYKFWCCYYKSVSDLFTFSLNKKSCIPNWLAAWSWLRCLFFKLLGLSEKKWFDK